MARLTRLYAPQIPQHILQWGINNQSVFINEADHALFLELLLDAARTWELAIHAYVLMPTHFHLLATPATANTIGRVLQAIGRRYVRHLNLRTGRSGTLWNSRYKSTLVDPKEWLLTCCRYIEFNPVRSGLVESAAQYPWSSYRHHIGIASSNLITDHAIYWALGNTPFERQARYKTLCDSGPLDEKAINELREATRLGWALGRPEFLTTIEALANRRVRPLSRGRPPSTTTRTAPSPQS